MYICEDKIENPIEKGKVELVLNILNCTNKRTFWRIKHTFDIILSLITLLVFLIPMAIIALIIFLGDRHNPIFKQERIGRFGKPFYMYKFRTMVPNADKLKDQLLEQNEMDGPVFKIANDPRITKFGKFLRKTSLDELPQFFNILKGDMTLIGPRPPLPCEVEKYTEFQKIRLIATPGITCLWQVQPNRNSISFEDWVQLDINYIVARNLLMDIRIIFRTAYVMFCGEGE